MFFYAKKGKRKLWQRIIGANVRAGRQGGETFRLRMSPVRRRGNLCQGKETPGQRRAFSRS